MILIYRDNRQTDQFLFSGTGDHELNIFVENLHSYYKRYPILLINIQKFKVKFTLLELEEQSQVGREYIVRASEFKPRSQY